MRLKINEFGGRVATKGIALDPNDPAVRKMEPGDVIEFTENDVVAVGGREVSAHLVEAREIQPEDGRRRPMEGFFEKGTDNQVEKIGTGYFIGARKVPIMELLLNPPLPRQITVPAKRDQEGRVIPAHVRPWRDGDPRPEPRVVQTEEPATRPLRYTRQRDARLSSPSYNPSSERDAGELEEYIKGNA